jgi:hypothetical protein
MSDLRLRARSVTEIVDAAFQLYKRDAVEYLLMTAIAYGPWLVARIVLLRSVTFSTPQAIALGGPLPFVLLVLGVFSYALMSAVLSRFSSDVYLAQPTGFGQVLRYVLPRLPRLIGAAILLPVIMGLGFIPIGILVAMTSLWMAPLGFIIAIVWIGYAAARFFAVFQLIVLEDRGVIAAFARSSQLSINRKGHILLTLCLAFLIFIMLSFAVSMVAQFLPGIAIGLALQSLYMVVAYPFIGLTQMILYYDTRIRSEGFDIEMMTGALPSATASTAS